MLQHCYLPLPATQTYLDSGMMQTTHPPLRIVMVLSKSLQQRSSDRPVKEILSSLHHALPCHPMCATCSHHPTNVGSSGHSASTNTTSLALRKEQAGGSGETYPAQHPAEAGSTKARSATSCLSRACNPPALSNLALCGRPTAQRRRSAEPQKEGNM